MLPRFLAAVVLALLVIPAAASAAPRVQHIKYRYGPLTIKPGQNTISIDGDDVPRPKVPGWITGFRPNLEYANGKIPGVDVLHLHHAVWLINGQPTFAAGEEKTNVKLPRPFGWRHQPDDAWALNHMVHNLLPNRSRVYLTYTIDFIPDSSPLAKKMKRVVTRWVDVQGGSAYPVFDVHRGTGANGRFTYPRDDPNAYAGGPPRNRQLIARDGVLVQTAGHLHPGGLYTDLMLTRNGRTVNVFRSRAKYWEPAGAVSWDVAMTATRSNWRVKVKRGDVLSMSATYDSKRGSWYESMGIMPVAFAPGARGGVDPFSGKASSGAGASPTATCRRTTTTAARRAGSPTRARCPTGRRRPPTRSRSPTSSTARATCCAAAPPRARPWSRRASRWASRTPTPRARSSTPSPPAARPATARPGSPTRSPTGPSTSTPASSGSAPRASPRRPTATPGRPPSNLGPGTYTYFCRVHPFMRGAFRVKD